MCLLIFLIFFRHNLVNKRMRLFISCKAKYTRDYAVVVSVTMAADITDYCLWLITFVVSDYIEVQDL